MSSRTVDPGGLTQFGIGRGARLPEALSGLRGNCPPQAAALTEREPSLKSI
jgi:hypothetical protein